jgi:hypothetical protein
MVTIIMLVGLAAAPQEAKTDNNRPAEHEPARLEELEWLIGDWSTTIGKHQHAANGPDYHMVEGLTIRRVGDKLVVNFTYTYLPRFDERTRVEFSENICRDGESWKKTTEYKGRILFNNSAVGGRSSGHLRRTGENTWTGKSNDSKGKTHSLELKRIQMDHFVYTWDSVRYECYKYKDRKASAPKTDKSHLPEKPETQEPSS